MNFDRNWTGFALDAEVEAFGTSRIASAHNKLRAEVAALNQPVKLSEWQELVAERDRLRDRIDAVREIYAGMEGFIAQTAPEGYLQRIVKQMYEAALGVEGK